MLVGAGCGSWLSSAGLRRVASRGVREQPRPRQHHGGSQKSRSEELLTETDNFAYEKEVTFQAQL